MPDPDSETEARTEVLVELLTKHGVDDNAIDDLVVDLMTLLNEYEEHGYDRAKAEENAPTNREPDPE